MTDETPFGHEKLDVYQHCLRFIARTETLIAETKNAPAVLDHLERASESVAEHIVNGNSFWSADAKCRYFDIARGSALECAACMDVCRVKGLVSLPRCNQEKTELRMIVKMISGLIRSQPREFREPSDEYKVATDKQNTEIYFDHERLKVYQFALDFVDWLEHEIKEIDVCASRWRKLDTLATSIVLNIAEGNGRSEASDHRNFVDIAHRSALKAALQLDLACAKVNLPPAKFDEGKKLLGGIVRMLLALRGYFAEKESD